METTKYKYHRDGAPCPGDQILVFGSNLLGMHGGGAARYAHDQRGAVWGVGEGPTGQCYALPTKHDFTRSLHILEVADKVNGFLLYAEANPDTVFFVTRIGCGLAGFTDDDIGPLFADAPTNCDFAVEWAQYLEDGAP